MTDVKFFSPDLLSGEVIIIPAPPSMDRREERDKQQKLVRQVSPDQPVITQPGYFSGQKRMVDFQTVWIPSGFVMKVTN